MTCANCKCTAVVDAAAVRAVRKWMTPAEAAVMVGVQTQTVRKWCTRGLLGSKCGPGRGRYRIFLEDLKRVAGEQWCNGTRG